MSDRVPLCLVVPCYNEAKRLRTDLFRDWIEHHPDVHFIFTDDGSRDQTLAVLNRLRGELGTSVTVLPLSKNNGKGEAVRAGITHAFTHLQPDCVGFWDADLATPLDAVPEFLRMLATRPDIEMIFGSRVKLLGRTVVRKAHRHYLGRVFATVVSNVLQLPIYDTQCGAKLFRASETTRQVFADPFLSKWIFDVEILARYIQRLGSPRRLEPLIYEYPLETWQDVADSKVRPADFLSAAWDIVRIRARYLT